MSEDQSKTPDEESPALSPRDRVMGMVKWTLGRWRQAAAAGLIFIGILIGVSVTWTYTASLAIDAEREKLGDALDALDSGEYEHARTLVRHVLNSGLLPRSEHGTPLFVLGAVKTVDAGSDATIDRRRTEYLVASRYQQESRSFGFSPGREKQGLALLGESLVKSRQIDPGIDVLTEALNVAPTEGGPLNVAIHQSLAEAHTSESPPKLELGLLHIDAMLGEENLPTDEKVNGLLLKSTILAQLGRFDEALTTVASQPEEAARLPRVLVTHGQLLLDSVEAARMLLPVQEGGVLPKQLLPKVEQAATLLNEALSADRQATNTTRRSLYLLGQCASMQGDTARASQLFSQTFRHYGATPEGLAALLAEADLLRKSEEHDAALLLYRRVLDNETEPANYHSDVLPIERLRERILEAVDDYLERRRFADAVMMIDRFLPLFSSLEMLSLRGTALQRWGNWQLSQATKNPKKSAALKKSGLRRLREAGLAYETLAGLRFGTEHYTTDIWRSAESYYRGHSYSSAARMLELFLQHEPEKLNAQALLRLGHVQLAHGHVHESIKAFEECIELYTRDNATYQARIECARAYWYLGDHDTAIKLLRVNLTESTLKPTSPEWKDSLFTLGLLKFDQDEYEAAIGTLEEAVERYPDDSQALQAQYMIGEAYRRWAQKPIEQLQQTRTESERIKFSRLKDKQLQRALDSFKVVQRAITLRGHGGTTGDVDAAMLRNCYMLEGAVLFDLKQYEDAIKAYSNVSSLYPNEPFVLETFVQIAHCWHRLDRPEKARGAIEQAQQVLDRLPADADFIASTAFNREEWRSMLGHMSEW